MAFFISYSRHDDQAVGVLIEDLGRTHHDAWVDQELGGGEKWWQEILHRIRSSDVFVLALSRHALSSRPCMAELAYANDLGIPILPVLIGDVDSLRMTPIAERQIIDYRERVQAYTGRSTVIEASVALVVAALDLAARRGDLPDPLPAAPPIPFEYLMQLRIAVDAPEISSHTQLQVLTQLKQALRDEQDAVAARDLVDLLRRLRCHPDVTLRNAQEIDEFLRARNETDDVPPDLEPQAPTPIERNTTDQGPRVEPGSAPSGLTPAATAGLRVTAGLRERRSLLAAGLGCLALGQIGSLVYDLSFIRSVTPSGAYTVDSRAFIAMTWLILLLSAVGFGMVRRPQAEGSPTAAPQ